jgi:hypothetical protein
MRKQYIICIGLWLGPEKKIFTKYRILLDAGTLNQDFTVFTRVISLSYNFNILLYENISF